MTTRHWDPRGVELLVNWTFEWNNNHEKQSRCDLTLKWQSIDHVNRPNFPGGNRDLHLFIPNFVVVYEFSLRCRSPHGFNSTGCIKYGLSILHPLTTCPNFVFLPSSSFRQFDDAKVVAVRWHHPKPLPGAPPPLTVSGGPRDVYSWLSVSLRDVVVSHFVGNIMICYMKRVERSRNLQFEKCCPQLSRGAYFSTAVDHVAMTCRFLLAELMRSPRWSE